MSCFLWMQFHLVNGSSPARVWSTKALSFHTNVTDNSILSNNNGTAATLIRKIGESTAVPIRKDTRTTQYPTISILVELTGELGNHLHHLAHGRVLQNIAGTFGIPTRLVLRRQSNAEKYKQTQKHLQKCFPNLRNFTFHHDTSKVTSQTSTSGNMTQMFHSRLRLHGGSNYSVTHRAVDALHQILQLEQQVATASDSQYPKLGLSTPFLHTSSMLSRELMNLYYDDFREFFAFDDSACCSDVPGPNEAVFVSL